MMEVRREQIPLLWSTVGETALATVSAEEQSCLEGVYTVRRSEKYITDESGKVQVCLGGCVLEF